MSIFHRMASRAMLSGMRMKRWRSNSSRSCFVRVSILQFLTIEEDGEGESRLALQEEKHVGQIDSFVLRLKNKVLMCYLVGHIGTGGGVSVKIIKSKNNSFSTS